MDMVAGFEDAFVGNGTGGKHPTWNAADWAWDPSTMTATTRSEGDEPPSKRAAHGMSHPSSLLGVRSCQSVPVSAMAQPASSQVVRHDLFGGDFVEHNRSISTGRLSGRSDTSLVEDESDPKGHDDDSGGGSPGRDDRQPIPTNATCQVEGCGRRLGVLSMYHQRSRICEVHLKLPSFIRSGKQQRFCQQCGRCHELHAFEGTKRSCKVQLNKHNARRRRRHKQSGGADSKDDGVKLTGAVRPLGPISGLGLPTRLDLKRAMSLGGLTPEVHQRALSMSLALVRAGPQGGPGTLPMTSVSMQKFLDAHASPAGMTNLAPNLALPSVLDISLGDLRAAPRRGGGLPPLPDDLNPSDPSIDEKPDTASMEATYRAAMRMMNSNPELLGGPPLFDPIPSGLPTYLPDSRTMRMWMKLFAVEPGDLPAELRRDITSWLARAPHSITGYLRSGCVHLTVDITMDRETFASAQEGGVESLVKHLMALPSTVWRQGQVLISLLDQVAYVKDGKLMAVYDGAGNKAAPPGMPPMPYLETLHPPLVVPLCGMGARVDLIGRNIMCGDCSLLARSRGRYLPTQALPYETCCAPSSRASAAELQKITLAIGPGLLPGLVWVEVQRGALLGPARPLLVLPDEEMSEDIEILLDLSAREGRGNVGRDSLLVDIGLLIEAEREGQGVVGARERRAATKLLGLALDAGLPDMATRMLNLGSGGRLTMDAITTIGSQLEEGEGLSILHRAVRCGGGPMLDTVVGWSSQNSFCWRADMSGPHGITPLHLSVLLDDGGGAAVTLAKNCSPGPSAWFSAAADDGTTPAGLASQRGLHALNIQMAQMLMLVSGSVPEILQPTTPVFRQAVPIELCFCREVFEASAASAGRFKRVDLTDLSACGVSDSYDTSSVVSGEEAPGRSSAKRVLGGSSSCCPSACKAPGQGICGGPLPTALGRTSTCGGTSCTTISTTTGSDTVQPCAHRGQSTANGPCCKGTCSSGVTQQAPPCAAKGTCGGYTNPAAAKRPCAASVNPASPMLRKACKAVAAAAVTAVGVPGPPTACGGSKIPSCCKAAAPGLVSDGEGASLDAWGHHADSVVSVADGFAPPLSPPLGEAALRLATPPGSGQAMSPCCVGVCPQA